MQKSGFLMTKLILFISRYEIHPCNKQIVKNDFFILYFYSKHRLCVRTDSISVTVLA